jgi:hypothetical protein
MFNSLRRFISYIVLAAALFSINAAPFAAQDRAIHQTLRFEPGTSHAYLNKRISRGTSHVYHLRARRGQYMAVILNTGDNTSFTIYSTRSGQLDNADGVKDWDGTLPETGEYLIEIGTDVSTNYELTVTIE